MKNDLKNINWDALTEDLIINCDNYYYTFNKINRFSGPSLYFHNRCLKSRGKDKIELVYATLVSWGMHRPGGGPKMNSFEIFRKSIKSNELEFNRLKMMKNEIIHERKACEFKKSFYSVQPNRTSTKIVGNSKVLAHYLPNLVCPIDREYTFQFVFGKKNIEIKDDEEQFTLFSNFHNNVIYKLIENNQFKVFLNRVKIDSTSGWNSSIPKIIDNIIIGKILGQKEMYKNIDTIEKYIDKRNEFDFKT